MPPRKPTDTQKIANQSYDDLDRLRRGARARPGDVDALSPARIASTTGQAAVGSVKAGARPMATPLVSKPRIVMPRGRSRR